MFDKIMSLGGDVVRFIGELLARGVESLGIFADGVMSAFHAAVTHFAVTPIMIGGTYVALGGGVLLVGWKTGVIQGSARFVLKQLDRLPFLMPLTRRIRGLVVDAKNKVVEVKDSINAKIEGKK
jgi:hypothetical protein